MDVKALEGTSKGIRNPLNAVMDTVRQIRRDDAGASGAAKRSTITAADNTSLPFKLAESGGDALVSKLRDYAAKHSGKGRHASLGQHADDFWIRACLSARKGDVERAAALLENYLRWRRDVAYDETTTSDKVREILNTGLFVVMGNVTRDDRPVLTVRYRFFNPRQFAAIDVARAIGVVVEYLLRTFPAAQTHGVVVLDDVANFSFGNFDLRVMHFLEKAFTQVMPMRLAAIHVVNPGWLVKTIFSMVAGFMSKKIQARINICEAKNADKLAQWFEKDQIPEFLNLGGSRAWTPQMLSEYVDELMRMRQIAGPAMIEH